MSKSFVTDAAKKAFTDAIRAIEARSCAEVVVAVRVRSASYLHADLIAGSIAAFGMLAYMLFAPTPFSHVSLLVDPVLVGVGIGLLSSRLPYTRRWFTPTKIREVWVDRAAKAAFYEKGVRATSQRIGILVFVSLLERHAAVIADSGVSETVDPDAWQRAVDAIDAAVAAGADGIAVAKIIEKLGDVLEPCLPVSEDDINELPDEVCH